MKNYVDLKALNPGLPIYIRPSDGVEPHVGARYGTSHITSCYLISFSAFSHRLMFFSLSFCLVERGVYEVRKTAGMTSDQILAQVQHLEAASTAINSKSSGGIGGTTFKLADII